MNPNTNIKIGLLKNSNLEDIISIYEKIGLTVSSKLPSVDMINENNKKLEDFEMHPEPLDKLIIGVRYFKDGNLYIHTTIYPNENCIKNPQELQLNYDKLIREHFRR